MRRGWVGGAAIVIGLTACGGATASEPARDDAGATPPVGSPPPNDSGPPVQPLPGEVACPTADAGTLHCARDVDFERLDTKIATSGALPANVATAACTLQVQLSVEATGPTACALGHATSFASISLQRGNEKAPESVVDGFHRACLTGLPIGQELTLVLNNADCFGGGGFTELIVRFEPDDAGTAAERFSLRQGASGSAGSARCASPDTPIATPTGERRMDSLREGDLVYSAEPEGFVVVPILQIRRVPVLHHRVVRVELASGRVVAMSAKHPLADGRTFDDLAAGGSLDGALIERAATVDYEHPFTMDVLPGSRSGTYVAAGVTVGSTLARKRERP